MDMADIIPRHLHACLAWMGRIPWIEVGPDDGLCERPSGAPANAPMVIYRSNWKMLGVSPGAEDHAQQLKLYYDMTKADSRVLMFIDAMGEVLARGPKLFAGSDAQWEAMSHVDLHLPVSAFRSPFPAMVFRIPSEWRAASARECGLEVQRAPLYAVVRCRQMSNGRPCVSVIVPMGDRTEAAYLFHDSGDERTIEQAITAYRDPFCTGGDIVDLDYCLRVARVALNLCLTLTHFGHTQPTPLDARRYKNNKKPGREMFRHGDFLSVQMKQDIVLHQRAVRDSDAGGDGATGREVKPHWRRGHWRREAGYREVIAQGGTPSLVFVRACLVRPDRVAGDIGHSQAQYRLGNTNGGQK